MKSAVETLNPTRVKLTVEVPFEELKPSLDAAYKKIGKQINVPGFRRGKVPAMVIDQRVGRDYVVGEAVNDALPQLYIQALQDNNITPLGQPELDLSEVEDGADLNFTAELDVKPAISLPAYAGLEVEIDDISVGDDDVDQQLETLRERFGSLSPVERAAAEGDFVTIDLSAAKDGEPIEEAQATGMSYQVGRGTMLEGLDETLMGMSAGDEATFASTLIGGEFKDQLVDVTVKVTAVQEQELPDLDDEFAQQASEFDTIDELKADLQDRITRGARMEQAAAARDAVLEKLLGMVDIPLPEAVIGEELKSRRDGINEQLAHAGMTEADYLESEGQSEEEFAAELDKRVRDAMAAQFLLDEISNAEAMSVDEGELTQHLLRRAQQSGQTPEAYIQHAMEHNHIPELVSEVRRGKALAHIVEHAIVKDASGGVVELKTLQPDGTYADPAELEAQAAAVAATEAEEPSTDAAAEVVASADYLTVEESDDADR
ncbi:MAG: trigger factor [Propionibacteriales bacterium]|nr:trigger factor [Propionibacteriales bacterium]